MTQQILFYRFVGLCNENLGISNTLNPELLMRELIRDGVEIGGYNLINTNDAICELSQRKDNPLPMDYCNLDNVEMKFNHTTQKMTDEEIKKILDSDATTHEKDLAFCEYMLEQAESVHSDDPKVNRKIGINIGEWRATKKVIQSRIEDGQANTKK